MPVEFWLSINMKTAHGMAPFATYRLGNDPKKAKAIFAQFRGSDAACTETALTMDFSEIRDGLPFPIALMGCTFDDVTYNIRVVTRELFRQHNLECD